MDHERLDDAFEALGAAVTADDAVETSRVTAAFSFHLDTHLAKEDAHLFRIVRERVPVEEQVSMVRTMSSQMPVRRVPDFTAWIYPLLGDDDRENFTRALAMLMPWEHFAPGIPQIREATGDGFAELARAECPNSPTTRSTTIPLVSPPRRNRSVPCRSGPTRSVARHRR